MLRWWTASQPGACAQACASPRQHSRGIFASLLIQQVVFAFASASENGPDAQPGPATRASLQIPGQRHATGHVPRYAGNTRTSCRPLPALVVAQGPRVVHHCKAASRGTPLIPASISPIQWKPGTQMGRPLGGLRKARLHPFEEFGLGGDHRTQSFRLQTRRFLQHTTVPNGENGLACLRASASQRPPPVSTRARSMSQLLHFDERNRFERRLVPAGA